MKLLLIEDDALIGQAVQHAIQDSGHVCDWLDNGKHADNALQLNDYSALLLDLGLPGKDGYSVLKELRQKKNNIPVIIITARDAVEDRILGLDLGADDYLVKPFSIDELNARIRAVIRRNQGESSPLIANADISLNPATKEVFMSGESVDISAKEYTVLYTLMSHIGKVFSRHELEEQVYGWNEEVASNAIEFLIHGIRKKLGKDSIKNIRGLGWVIKKSEVKQ